MKNYKVIIFDLDGTLSNSQKGILNSLRYALEKFGIYEPDDSNIIHFIGPPMYDELVRTYNFSDEDAKKGVEIYRERYTPIGLYETEIYPGTEEMLKGLKAAGKVIAMATSKPQGMAEEVLKHLGIYDYFDFVQGADLVGPIQSKESVINELLKKLGDYEKEELLMVGDTHFDIDGANAVGIDSVGVAYGFGDNEDMLSKGALAIADDAKDLLNMLV